MGRARGKKSDRGSGTPPSRSGGGASKKAAVKIVDELLRLAEEGEELPWERPWNVLGLPRNGISEREYRGINLFYLGLLASARGYNSTRWLTYDQAAERSFQQWRKEQGLPDNDKSRAEYEKSGSYRGVRKGERGTPVVFFKMVPRKEGGRVVLDENGEPETRKLRLHYNVFNAEQTDLDFPPEDVEERDHVERIESAEWIVGEFKNAPQIEHGGNEACYVPSRDLVRMPPKERFHSDEDYYHALFHELVHATGHSSRTNRTDGNWSGMGSESYAEEELVAEMGAAILSAHAGIRSSDRAKRHSAAYIQGWMKKLRDDPDLLIRAATKAQSAVDHILGTKFEYETESS